MKKITLLILFICLVLNLFPQKRVAISPQYYGEVYVESVDEVFSPGWITINEVGTDKQLIKMESEELAVDYTPEGEVKINIKELPYGEQSVIIYDDFNFDGIKDFANKVVNHQLKEMKVPEDRLIGPFFLNSTELSNSETSNEAISGKLFVYLWDDVLRHKGRNIIFDKNIGTFGELHEQFIEGKKPVFSEVIESLIISNGNTADDTTGVTEGDE